MPLLETAGRLTRPLWEDSCWEARAVGQLRLLASGPSQGQDLWSRRAKSWAVTEETGRERC